MSLCNLKLLTSAFVSVLTLALWFGPQGVLTPFTNSPAVLEDPCICDNPISSTPRKWDWYLTPFTNSPAVLEDPCICDNPISGTSRKWDWYFMTMRHMWRITSWVQKAFFCLLSLLPIAWHKLPENTRRSICHEAKKITRRTIKSLRSWLLRYLRSLQAQRARQGDPRDRETLWYALFPGQEVVSTCDFRREVVRQHERRQELTMISNLLREDISIDWIINRMDVNGDQRVTKTEFNAWMDKLNNCRPDLNPINAGGDDKLVYAIVGHMGVGKSTLVNAMLGELWFDSKFDHCPVTKASPDNYKDKAPVPGAQPRYYNFPGFGEEGGYEERQNLYKSAFSTQGYLKLLFVFTLEGGRIRPDVSHLLQQVLNMMPWVKENDYGIMVNKLTVAERDEITSPEFLDFRTTLFMGLRKAIPKTEHIYFMVADPAAEKATKHMLSLPTDFLEFVCGIPTIKLGEEVKPLVEETVERYRRQVKDDAEKAQKTMEEVEKKHKEEMQAAELRMQRERQDMQQLQLSQEDLKNELVNEKFECQRKVSEAVEKGEKELREKLEEERHAYEKKLQEERQRSKQQLSEVKSSVDTILSKTTADCERERGAKRKAQEDLNDCRSKFRKLADDFLIASDMPDILRVDFPGHVSRLFYKTSPDPIVYKNPSGFPNRGSVLDLTSSGTTWTIRAVGSNLSWRIQHRKKIQELLDQQSWEEIETHGMFSSSRMAVHLKITRLSFDDLANLQARS